MAKDAQSLLEIELDQLCNSVKHLERSNAELKEALQEGPDPDLRAAFNENIVVIAKQRARIASLRDEIMKLRGHSAPNAQAGAVAVPLNDADSQQPDQGILGSSQEQGAGSSMEVEHAQHGTMQQGSGHAAAGNMEVEGQGVQAAAAAPPPSGSAGDSMDTEQAEHGKGQAATGATAGDGMWL
mmetsp:Transcript_33464/g.84803  ORF Transcript_33464/g.84803 Transcript_33464/m.84803 type:complete len:183 (-) Transcript_33464:244-792(-)